MEKLRGRAFGPFPFFFSRKGAKSGAFSQKNAMEFNFVS
jgi:hypothetical protein